MTLDFLMATPVIVKVLASLALMLALNVASRRLIPSVLAATLALALWCGHPLLPGSGDANIALIAWRRLVSTDNLLLLVVVYQVLLLSSQMASAGVMQDLVDAVRARTSKRAAMGVLPAVIGFLPMPGGALFSAPMVEQCDAEGAVKPVVKTRANYWFRHVWEYWWPLYPGVLLALAYTGLEVWQFILLQLPVCLVALTAGYWFLLRRVHPGAETPADKPADSSRSIFELVLPIIVTIGTYAAAKLGWGVLRRSSPGLPTLHRYVPMALGLCLAIGWLQRQRPLQWAKWRGLLLSPKSLRMVVLVALIRVYGGMIETELPGGMPVAEAMRGELAAWGVPLVLIIVLLPFLSGFSTGLAVGFVGASFPVLMNVLGADPTLGERLAMTVLAYGSGYMGMMLSPVHLCLIVSNEHFDTGLAASLKGLLPPAIAVLLGSAGMHVLIARFWG